MKVIGGIDRETAKLAKTRPAADASQLGKGFGCAEPIAFLKVISRLIAAKIGWFSQLSSPDC
ncbi:hypothetical protein ATE76_08625 [Sphingopyxis sp. H093]|nr:hypothetical protein ATE76_08625 [Sphingopyxis sp. H093]KTE31136.1 hypothetical protein ATE75_01035 [Sphingopyxis sp. H080]